MPSHLRTQMNKLKKVYIPGSLSDDEINPYDVAEALNAAIDRINELEARLTTQRTMIKQLMELEARYEGHYHEDYQEAAQGEHFHPVHEIKESPSD